MDRQWEDSWGQGSDVLLEELLEGLTTAALQASCCVECLERRNGGGQHEGALCFPVAVASEDLGKSIQLANQSRRLNSPSIGLLAAENDCLQALDLKLLAAYTTKYWEIDRATLTVSFLGGVSLATKNRIVEYFNVWLDRAEAGIQFRLTNDVGDVRISTDSLMTETFVGTDILLASQGQATSSVLLPDSGVESIGFRSQMIRMAGHLLGISCGRLPSKVKSKLQLGPVYEWFQGRYGWGAVMVDRVVFGGLGAVRSPGSSIMEWQFPGVVFRPGQALVASEGITLADVRLIRSLYA